MTLVEILLIAMGLAMDAFAVCIGAGAQENQRGGRAAFRLSFHFGLFQFLMTVAGWGLGTSVEKLIRTYDHWVAFGLLAFVGIRMVRAGLETRNAVPSPNLSRGLSLISLSIATSLDALAVGVSLGVLEVNIWPPSLVIGLVAAAFSLGGLKIGRRLGTKFGKRMETAGGVLLILIGLRILVAHLLD
jgi:putative Mn2+ efflux pump MntP